MVIEYVDSAAGLAPDRLTGFFAGWPNPPSPEMHRRILRRSDCVVLAIDPSAGRVVGFINALTDRVLSAYIPLLEVLPEYRGQGIGSELVRRLLKRLSGLYMIDLMCDPSVQPSYERLGFVRAAGMSRRDFSAQGGKPD
ncbi:MAG TPA: GNAT family N-acetyltransferase [candidate division Zixibacteria bacterium]|nr:GNAT family N-acetyltransferase [candidate division Zixibacteria bacterium]MDD4918849.1 GNAT family N-acetyltransferase [candidate division Zixibacteria bacterium]MDM7974334.1 GNAT family N-acetyltransferase [candidate division Zixibacteria bacterium]HOD66346.1 GNAT family N-acetyltransferase [candidate division Zixibacteria bacterium]HPC10574.1 GNAT family N-acetyltransferase [candidate division Zixibacteria bacterium]